MKLNKHKKWSEFFVPSIEAFNQVVSSYPLNQVVAFVPVQIIFTVVSVKSVPNKL